MPQYAEVICKLTPENQPLLFHLADRIRSRKTNRILGGFLTFSAGAINAGGFLAVGQYTSHMTGIISSVADNLALSKFRLAIAGILAFVSFVSGAASTSLFINWARRRRLHSEFAISIALEAILLLVFGLIGANLNVYLELFIPTTVVLLTYIMGLQNAIITKISKAEIRTTHMTGVITDLGIELGRLLYWNRHKAIHGLGKVTADRRKLVIHATILGLFITGAIVGALSFKKIGFLTTVPISVAMLLIAVPPLWRDFSGNRFLLISRH